MKKCKQGYYYCYKDKKCKKIPSGYRIGLGGWLRKEKDEETEEKKKNGNGNGANGNGNGNGESNGGSNGGGVSEAWSSKYKKSIDCNNPKGFSQRAHCRGRKKMNEETCPICGCDPCQCLEGGITEARDGKSSKDKGYSLRDWFKGGGWKQTGGKYDGKPCAKQPGQKTKPYCRDADDRAAMSKEERNKRAAKKRKEDPNPNRKGKAKNVTQESYSDWRTDFEKLDEVAPLVVGGAAAALAAPYLLKRFVKPQVDKMLDGATKITPSSNPQNRTQPSLQQTQQDARDIGKMTGTSGLMNTTINTSNRLQSKYDRLRSTMRDAGMSGADQNMNMRGVMMKNSYQPEGEVVEAKDPGPGDAMPGHAFFKNAAGGMTTLNKVDEKIRAANKKKGEFSKEEVEIVDEGKKDACYHKVKSRYSVWPSAYASGALVKCRKVGAKNWGNKTKKEEFSNWRNDLEEMASEKKINKKLQKPVDSKKLKPANYVKDAIMMPGHGIEKKIQDDYQYSNWRDDFTPTEYETTDLIKADPIQVPPSNLQKIEEAKKCWKGYKKTGTQKLFGKTYNRCEKIKKEHYDWRAELEEGAAWTKKSGKNPSGGLNEKGRKSYERENPGSDLKRPSKKVGNKRRKSFCARMKGMKKKLTSKKTANDPNSRINKSLRAWNC